MNGETKDVEGCLDCFCPVDEIVSVDKDECHVVRVEALVLLEERFALRRGFSLLLGPFEVPSGFSRFIIWDECKVRCCKILFAVKMFNGSLDDKKEESLGQVVALFHS